MNWLALQIVAASIQAAESAEATSDPIEVRLSAGLVAGSTERQDQFFFEAQADVQIRLWKAAALTFGYRVHTLHFRQSTNRSGLNFIGPFVGAEIAF